MHWAVFWLLEMCWRLCKYSCFSASFFWNRVRNVSQLKYLFPSTGCTEAFCQTEVIGKNLLFTNFQSVAVLIYNGRISGCGNLCKEVIRNSSLETTAMVFLWSALRADLFHHLFLSVISTLTFVWFPIFRSWVKLWSFGQLLKKVWIWTFDVCHRNFCSRNYNSITIRWLCCSYHIMWENHAIYIYIYIYLFKKYWFWF